MLNIPTCVFFFFFVLLIFFKYINENKLFSNEHLEAVSFFLCNLLISNKFQSICQP